ncbi:MAG: AraC family transcriptional regulator [Kangiella sp.]|nr:MAG: AraC family transcriptional regulator [Kangiella sp.]
MNSSIFIVYPRALLTGLSLPMEMISSAKSIANIKQNRRVKWDCDVVSSTNGEIQPIKLSSGIDILPKFNLRTASKAKTIFIPPIWGQPDVVIRKNQALIEWLKIQSAKGTQIVATGTGVCLLAEAGLLNAKIATTHWYYFEQFESRYPNVNLKREHFITQDENIICTGSINALVDLTLYFIENEFGNDVSQVIEQHYSHEINRTYDKPWFSEGSRRHPDEGIMEVQQWMETHFAQHFSLESLSEMANMSQRNFSRRFKQAVGKSAFDYSLELKMKGARELLKNTNLNLQDIADRLGFKDNAYFSRQFKRQNKITPSAYREMVRAKLFNLN